MRNLFEISLFIVSIIAVAASPLDNVDEPKSLMTVLQNDVHPTDHFNGTISEEDADDGKKKFLQT